MIYYFLPDRFHFGGVKVACQFVEMLNDFGIPAVICMQDGRAPHWFVGRYAVIAEADAMLRITDRDTVMIAWPPDHRRLADLPGRRACHVLGTDDWMDDIFADPDCLLLTCWDQATRHVRANFGREPIEIGIHISDCFFHRAEYKLDNLVSYMPRRGFRILLRCLLRAVALDFRGIDGMDETDVAALLQRSGMYLATSVGEQFGLPALEAMAAGCVVVSVPVKGGMDYLRDGDNCVIAEPEALPEALARIARPDHATERVRMRHSAIHTALSYRRRVQQKALGELLDQGLASVLT